MKLSELQLGDRVMVQCNPQTRRTDPPDSFDPCVATVIGLDHRIEIKYLAGSHTKQYNSDYHNAFWIIEKEVLSKGSSTIVSQGATCKCGFRNDYWNGTGEYVCTGCILWAHVAS